MLVKLDHFPPIFGVKMKKIVELPPPSLGVSGWVGGGFFGVGWVLRRVDK